MAYLEAEAEKIPLDIACYPVRGHPAAVRMRLHRKRRRDGMQYVQIPLQGRDSRIYAEPCPERIRQVASVASPTDPDRR
jgi:hypothetical protein